MKDNEINLLENVYDDNTMVEIPGNFLYSLLPLLEQVQLKETDTSFVSSFPESSKKVMTSDKKELEKVDINWSLYPNPNSYFNQIPVETTSLLGVMAMERLLIAKTLHLENIKKGLTKVKGSFEQDVKLD